MASTSKNPPSKYEPACTNDTHTEDSAETERRFERSASMVLRELSASEYIKSTEALVRAYNEEERDAERDALLRWLQKYVEWFNENSAKRIQPTLVIEFACLAHVKPRCQEDKSLLTEVFTSICEKAKRESYDDAELCLAVADALLAIDESVFDGVTAKVSTLAFDLLKKLKPTRTVFSEGNYATHRVILFALRQAMLMHHRIAPSETIPVEGNGFFHCFDAKLRDILQCCSFYPTRYEVRVVQETLRNLPECSHESYSLLLFRKVVDALRGSAYIFRAARGVFLFDFDVESVEKGYKSLTTVFQDDGFAESSWFKALGGLNEVVLICLQDGEKADLLTECSEQLLTVQRRMTDREDQLALRFGLISQLGALAMEAEDAELRRCACQELMLIATKFFKCECWIKEPEIFKLLLRTLGELHVAGEYRELTEPALAVLASFDDETSKKIVSDWLGESQLEEWLEKDAMPRCPSVPLNRLFKIVKDTLGGMYSSVEVAQKRKSLKDYYLDPSFATVPRLFDELDYRRVEDLQFRLVCDENINVEPDDSIEEGGQKQISAYRQRMQKVRRDIEVDEVFADRQTAPNTPAKKIMRVLLVGNPGCGKTSVARKIAHSWALGSWGAQFEAVYLLPVRSLNKNEFDGSENRGPTLDCAAARLCFHWSTGKEFQMLSKHVQDDLRRKSTLLILDGLDEADGTGERMIRDSLELPCSTLLLSRPYNLQAVHIGVDVKMECLGMTPPQLTNFVRSELSQSSSESLLGYFSKNPTIEELAQVPVVANILCLLWKENKMGRVGDDVQLSSAVLYQTMAEVVWYRFNEKYPSKGDRDATFLSLSRIALEAYDMGQIQISVFLIEKHSKVNVSERILKQVGFLLLKMEGGFYHFAHLTFQEFFAAKCLAHHLFANKESQRKSAERFIVRNRFSPEHETVLTFLTEQVCSVHGLTGFDRLMHVAAIGVEDSMHVQHALFKLKLVDAFVSSSKEQSHVPLDDESVLGAIEYVVSLVKCYRDNERELRTVLSGLAKELHAVACFPSLFDAVLECFKSQSSECQHEAATAASKLARASPAYASAVLDALSRVFHDERSPLRSQAVGLLKTIAKVIPKERESEVLDLVGEACRDANDVVRNHALAQIQPLILELPHSETRFWSLMEELCTDANPHVRDDAWKPLSDIAKAVPEQKDRVLKLVKQFCTAAYDDDVTASAVHRLQKLAGARPELLTSALKILRELCLSDNSDVRLNAFSVLHVFVADHPKSAIEILRIAEHGIDDYDVYVRVETFSQLAEIADFAPALTDDVFFLLEKGCRSKDEYVRSDARSQMVELVEQNPDRASMLMSALSSGCQDEDRYVKEATVRLLADLYRVLPGQRGDILNILVEGCQDRNAYVRSASFSQLLELSEKSYELPHKVVDVTLNGCEDDDKNVQLSAFSILLNFIEDLPLRRNEILAVVKEKCCDKDQEIRIRAVLSLSRCAKCIPEKSDDVQSTLHKYGKDPDSGVQAAALIQLVKLWVQISINTNTISLIIKTDWSEKDGNGAPKGISVLVDFIKSHPQRRSQALATIGRLCRIETVNDSIGACSALPVIARELPAEGEAIFEIAMKLCCGREDDSHGRTFTSFENSARQQGKLRQNLASSRQDSTVAELRYRYRAFEPLSCLAREIPDRRDDFARLLSYGCKDGHRSVRAAAFKCLRAMAKEVPKIRDDVVQLLRDGCKDGDDDVRAAAFQCLPAMARHVQEIRDDVVQLLGDGCKDEDGYVRDAAFQCLPAIAKQMPEIRDDVVQLLGDGCKDGDGSVRAAAFKCLRAMAKEVPEIREDVVQLLGDCCKDGHRSVRAAAFKCLRAMAKEVPEIREDVVQLLRDCCKDGYQSVRAAAVHCLPDMAKQVPESRDDMVQLLRDCCKDGDGSVRAAALQHLPGLEQEVPEIRDAVIQLLRDYTQGWR